MCGIAGILDGTGATPSKESVLAMQRAMEHRGPDDGGTHFDRGLAFAFRRLSILDLKHGHQPMSSPDGRYTVVFNGEIYNHLELRPELEARGRKFHTHSDTETLLAGYEAWGTGVFEKLNGMFACGVWDRDEQMLTIARDPIGVKPLFYAFQDHRFYFASELRSLIAAGVSAEPNPAAVRDFLEFGYVHAPASILKVASKLAPGTWLKLGKGGAIEQRRFWSPPQPPERKGLDEREAANELSALLDRVVMDQMLSDVPVGAFLSGGVDSSLVVSSMVRATSKPVQTFSIGFDGAPSGTDESKYARAVARAMGTTHHELRMPANLLDGLEDLVGHMDEPIADMAMLPTLALSRYARKRVKVVLTGEGGDELFAGYGHYNAALLTEKLDRLPGLVGSAVYGLARRYGKGRHWRSLPLRGAAEYAGIEPKSKAATLERLLSSHGLPQSGQEWLAPLMHLSGVKGLLAFDLQTTLPGELLMKTDNTTMCASLEARVPLLDLRLIEFAFSLPTNLQIRRFRGKYLLRKVAQERLPREVWGRRKHGFNVPLKAWMRDSKNALVQDALTDRSFLAHGWFDEKALSEGLRRLRSNEPHADPTLFMRLTLLSLWLKSLKN